MKSMHIVLALAATLGVAAADPTPANAPTTPTVSVPAPTTVPANSPANAPADLPAILPTNPIPQPFIAQYRLLRDGIHIADARFTLARDGEDGWKFSSETKPAGLIALLRSDVITEQSAFRLGSEHPIPLYYNYVHQGSSKDRDAHYSFDWQHARVIGTYRGKPVDLSLARGTLDPLTLRLAAGLDLARGALPPSYSVIEKRQVRQYPLTAIPAQRVKVDAGVYDAQGVARVSDDGTKTTRFLYAPALGWAPVMMEQDETDEATYRLELVSFTRK